MTTLPQHPSPRATLTASVVGSAELVRDEPRFSRRLAELTSRQHEEAENSGFMQDLMSGRLDVDAYARLSGQLVHVYAALEARGRELAADPLAAAVLDPALERSVALEADLLALSGDSWRARHPMLAATQAYVDRIAQLDGGGYLAHHYVRYLGDLSGGFIVARLVSRAYGLTPGEPGLLFHHFPAIPKPKPYKDHYRARIDQAAQHLSAPSQDAVIGEAQAAFALNTAIFRELASPARPRALVPRGEGESVTRPSRPARPQVVLEVRRVERLTPHLIRIVAGGEGFAAFQDNHRTDAYVKLHFADPALGLEPPYDMAALREQLPPEQMPSTRTYTVRWVDHAARELALDFVPHGEGGLAGPWAEQAQPGDVICFGGPGGGFSPNPDADWHLFAGDDAALPAIARSIEHLAETQPGAVGHALIEVDSPADEIPIASPAGIDITWLHRRGAEPGTTRLLDEGIRNLGWRAGRACAFVHGERETMKRMRHYLFTERGMAREDVSLSAYWAFGRTEDRFQAEKREEVGKVL